MLSQKLKNRVLLKKNFYIKLIKSNKYSKILFNLRHDKVDLKHTLEKKKIKFEDHNIWYKKFLNNKNFLFLIYNKIKIIGYLRLESENKFIKYRKDFFLSIFIKKEYRGQYIGSAVLKNISILFSKKNLLAYINRKDEASIYFFKKNGFKKNTKKKKFFLV